MADTKVIIDEATGKTWTEPTITYLCDVLSRNDGGYISLYKCERCGSVVDDEQLHIDSHKGLQVMRNALSLVLQMASVLAGK